MPEFTPTDWMLTMHRKKSDQDWEVYAECLREAMAKTGDFQITNIPVRTKLEYEDIMNGRRDDITIEGKRYTMAS